MKLLQSLFLLALISFPFITTGQIKNMGELAATMNRDMPDSSKLTLYKKIIAGYNETGSDSALVYANRGLQFFTSRKYKRGQARMMLAKTEFDNTHGTPVATEHLQDIMVMFKKEKDTAGIVDVYNLLAETEGKKGNFVKSAEYLLELLKIATARGDKKGMVAAYINLGSINDDNRNYDKALEYYSKAGQLSEQYPLVDNNIKLYNNLFTHYYALHDTANALKYIDKAISLSNNPNFTLQHIKLIMNRGNILVDIGRKDEGLNYLKYALSLLRNNSFPNQEATVWLNLAFYQTGDKPIDTLISYIDSADRLVKITQDKHRQSVIYAAYSELYAMKKDYKNAYTYVRKFHKLSDTLFNLNKTKEVAGLISEYELKLSGAKVAALETLIRKNETKRNIIAGISVVLVILLITVLYYNRKTMRLNRELKQGKLELAEMNMMKDKLFSVIGHDLRGPIANIPALLEMIEQDGVLPDEYREMVGTLKDHTNVTLDTLENLMIMGKGMMKGTNYQPQTFNPARLTAKAVNLFTMAAGKKNVVINNNTPNDLSVIADPAHFEFLIRNLLSNAVKYSYTDSSIELKANKTSIQGFVIYSVTDHGTGIPEETRKNLFKNFVDSTYGTDNEKGNGIGLKLCEEFVELNGGKIWVESKEGKGATFFFTLKIA